MKQKFYLLVALFMIVPLLTSGCALHSYVGGKYYYYGHQAAEAGNWELARQNFSRANTNAQLGFLGPATEAYCTYEWSRVTGYLGKYADAEKGFDYTLKLIDKARGKADKLLAPTLCELARLLHDTDQHQKAIPVYEKALSVLEKTTVAKDDPIAFAEFLDDYTGSLRAAGYDSRADEVSNRAAMIREENKGLTARFIATRYKAEPVATMDGVTSPH